MGEGGGEGREREGERKGEVGGGREREGGREEKKGDGEEVGERKEEERESREKGKREKRRGENIILNSIMRVITHSPGVCPCAGAVSQLHSKSEHRGRMINFNLESSLSISMSPLCRIL